MGVSTTESPPMWLLVLSKSDLALDDADVGVAGNVKKDEGREIPVNDEGAMSWVGVNGICGEDSDADDVMSIDEGDERPSHVSWRPE